MTEQDKTATGPGSEISEQLHKISRPSIAAALEIDRLISDVGVPAAQDTTFVPKVPGVLSDQPPRYENPELPQVRPELDHVMVGCQVIGFDWRYLYVNDAVAEHGRRPKHELLGHTMTEVYPGIENTQVFAALKRCMEERTHQRMENEFFYPDGTSRWFDIDIHPDPEGILVLSFDITERKCAEESIRRSEATYRTLVESLPQKICLKDLDLRWITCNNNFLKDLGCTAEQVVGKTDFDFYSREIAEKHRAMDLRVLATGMTEEFDEVYVQGNDRSIVHVVKAMVRDATGSPRGILAIFWNITEKKRVENKLIETLEALKRSNSELEQFAYVASHDLQEPLRMVSNFTQLLGQRYKGKLDKDADEFIGYAVDGANRMQTLISDLLTYSRLETRGKSMTLVDVNSPLEHAIANLAIAIEESEAEITHNQLPQVFGDETQLVQLFQNLLSNAIKFRADLPPRIHVSAREHHGEWRFSVQDNGIGISAEYYERIFVLFQRLHPVSVYSGTGIGLTICKKIVARHRGRIWVESEPGKGSTFYFTLPMPGNGP